MAQIRIKRSTGTSAPQSTDLAQAELAFAEGNDILYIGEGTSGNNAASVLKIGGSGAFMALEGAQTVGGNKTFSNNVTVTGDLTVNGTTTTVATTNTTVSDNILELNSGAGSNANDCGILIERGSTGNNAFIGWDESADQFVLGTTTAAANSTGNLSISAGTIQGNITGSAASLTTGRNITLTGDVSGLFTGFNGTSDINISTTLAAASVERNNLHLVSTSSSPGLTVKGDGTTDGYLQLNCSQNSHGIKLKSPAHSAQASYTLTFPTTDGNSNQLLKTDGSGGLDWVSLTGGAGITVSGHAISVTNDSITEAMLDIHNSPTDGYILKYSSSNGLVWEAAGAGGDVNQNAFSNISVSGQTTVAADSATDTLNLAAGSNVTITTNSSNDTVTIASTDTDTTYSAGTGLSLSGTTFSLGNHSASLLTSGTIPAARVPTLNQNTTGSAATLTTARTIAGVAFDGSANISLNNNAITNGAGYITSSGSISGNAATASTATVATNSTITANNSTNETVYLTFVDAATGTQGLETDTGLEYNPSTGKLDFAVLDGGSY